MSASWQSRSDSWNTGRTSPSSGSWTGSRAPLSPDRCHDERWEVEWSSFLPQWGPHTVPVRRKGDGRPAADEWEPKWKRGAAGWGANKWKPQATSTWGGSSTPEPCAFQGVCESNDSCLSQGDSMPLARTESLDVQTGSYWDRPRQASEAPKETTVYASEDDGAESAEESESSFEDEEIQMKESLPRMPGMETCKKDEEIDDVSTQAGTTLTSHSVAAESCGEATQTDNERFEEGLDDTGLSDAESSTSSGAIGSTEEEEFETEEIEGCSEIPESLACKAIQSPPKQATAKGKGLESIVVSPGSWAEKQRLRQMERERAGTCSVIMERADAQQLECQQVLEPNSSEHDKKGVKVFESSAGSWAAQVRLRRADSEANKSEQLSPEEISRKAKCILNKLTEERFELLCQQICALPVHTAEQLAALVAEIFDKATTEKCFLTLYTELCARLDSHLAAEGSCVGGKVFRKALVTECQATFERNLQQPLDLKTLEHLSYEERYVEEVKHKTRTLGNMRFIGQLLVRKLLAGKILFFIVNEMLDINSEASLESLMELLSIVAPALEQKGTIYEAPLREMFATLKKKSKDMTLSMRIRCKMSDLLDLRSSGWVGKVTATPASKDKAKTAAGASRKR